jgi:hypothetical protein
LFKGKESKEVSSNLGNPVVLEKLIMSMDTRHVRGSLISQGEFLQFFTRDCKKRQQLADLISSFAEEKDCEVNVMRFNPSGDAKNGVNTLLLAAQSETDDSLGEKLEKIVADSLTSEAAPVWLDVCNYDEKVFRLLANILKPRDSADSTKVLADLQDAMIFKNPIVEVQLVLARFSACRGLSGCLALDDGTLPCLCLHVCRCLSVCFIGVGGSC